MGKALCVALAAGWLVLTGCESGGGGRFDATNEATTKASLKRMTAGKTEAQKKQFIADCAAIAAQAATERAMHGSPTSPAEGFKPLHGLTASQIRAKADEVRQSRQAR